jgi:hypothetical protein
MLSWQPSDGHPHFLTKWRRTFTQPFLQPVPTAFAPLLQGGPTALIAFLKSAFSSFDLTFTCFSKSPIAYQSNLALSEGERISGLGFRIGLFRSSLPGMVNGGEIWKLKKVVATMAAFPNRRIMVGRKTRFLKGNLRCT